MSAAEILIVEDSMALSATYQEYLGRAGYTSQMAATADSACRHLKKRRFDAVLMDLNLPDGDGISLLARLRKEGMDIPVVVITADPSIETAVRAIRAGAQDFISKPVTAARLNLTLRNVLEQQALKNIVNGYRAMERDRFCDFIGRSPAMQIVYRMLENAAQSRAPVFITGASGTGKELAARAIHQLSPRKAEAFEALNCAAVPGNLLESEIFGHARGAFTGAVARYDGAAARAHKGTLFLDELPEMPVEMQSKLLRFTQSGVFRPLGAGQEQAVDVRFVSATNRDPLQAMAEGQLREDLYYRLNVISIHLPPLSARGDDVLLIAQILLARMTQEERKDFEGLDEGAAAFLLQHDWPGNVRQLQNTLRRAVVMHNGPRLTRGMLQQAAGTVRQASQAPAASQTAPAPADMLPAAAANIRPLREVEREIVERALVLCGGNITEAAKRLGLNASTLHRKLNKWREAG